MRVVFALISAFPCALPAAAQPLVATDFVKYFGSNTNYSVSGTVEVTEITDQSSGVVGQSLTWNLQSTDSACPTGSGNQCGIHIHTGTSCSADAGGHYFSVQGDPWLDTKYDANANGESTKSSTAPLRVITNLTLTQVIGRTIIVHNSIAPGERIACAVLQGSSTSTKKGTAVVSGAAAVSASALAFALTTLQMNA